MVQEGVTWFGDRNPDSRIVVSKGIVSTGNACPALDPVGRAGAQSDKVITLGDFAQFALWYNKSCQTESNTLSCGSVDTDRSGKVDLVDLSKLANYFYSGTDCSQ